MINQIFTLILAALGLGFLVFIHELGHFFMARRSGMTVEVFSIGFGKPIYSWKKNGVQWKICYLLFGGYVKIAGMEKKGSLDPHQISDGFYGKSPWARIKVSLMGPVTNLVFAFVAFTAIWFMGGRDLPFQEFTHIVGWVDSESPFYKAGIRPGDIITKYNGQVYEGYEDLIYSTLKEGNNVQVEGFHVDSISGKRTPFNSSVLLEKRGNDEIPLFPSLQMAKYLIYDADPACQTDTVPICQSGIEKGDRLFSIDGEIVYSLPHLQQLVNEPKSLLTIERDGKLFQQKIPRIKIVDLFLSDEEKSEIDDWKHEANLKAKTNQLYFIPYALNHDAVIEKSFNEGAVDLKKGDKIVAVDGFKVSNSHEFLSKVQSRHVQIVVQRGENLKPISSKLADKFFENEIASSHFREIIDSIGTNNLLKQSNGFYLLSPVEPLPVMQVSHSPQLQELWDQREKEIAKIENPEARAEQSRKLLAEQNRLILGINFEYLNDKKVVYNPAPWSLCMEGLNQTWATLNALFRGNLHPKQLASPVAIVGIMQQSWSHGFHQALYWLAFISLNLAIFNLLPIPVLDGGHVCFALWESATKKPVSTKVMERITVPFMILLIGFMIYLTFNDIVKILRHLF